MRRGWFWYIFENPTETWGIFVSSVFPAGKKLILCIRIVRWIFICVVCHRGLVCFTDKGKVVEWEDKMDNLADLFIKTCKIMVFRQDTEKGIGAYTEDIGDLYIFVGDNEPFCLSASDYPGLKPNSVYFDGRCSDYRVCNFASSTICYLFDSPLQSPSSPLLTSSNNTPPVEEFGIVLCYYHVTFRSCHVIAFRLCHVLSSRI